MAQRAARRNRLAGRAAIKVAPFVAAGLLGTGVLYPLPAAAAQHRQTTPVSFTDTNGVNHACTFELLIDDMPHGEATLRAGVSTVLDLGDNACVADAIVCQQAFWTDPFGHADQSARACDRDQVNLEYAPVGGGPFILASSVHFDSCTTGCDWNASYAYPSPK
jgi:hypothetical protein